MKKGNRKLTLISNSSDAQSVALLSLYDHPPAGAGDYTDMIRPISRLLFLEENTYCYP